MQVKIIENGFGKAVNPYLKPVHNEKYPDVLNNPSWHKFDKANPPLQVISPNPLTMGDVIECDVVWQSKEWVDTEWFYGHIVHVELDNRQVYIPLPAKDGEGKELKKLFIEPKRNWTEDFEHENGNYNCLCGQCEQIFIGHKRRVRCKLCASETNNTIPSEMCHEESVCYFIGVRFGATYQKSIDMGEVPFEDIYEILVNNTDPYDITDKPKSAKLIIEYLKNKR